MLCPACGKESSNVRVCGFCQTPYPTDLPARTAAPRQSRATAQVQTSKEVGGGRQPGDPRTAMERRARAIRWGVIGLLAAFTAGYWFMGRERDIPVGVAMPNLIAAPMSPAEAAAFQKTVNAGAHVEDVKGELLVRLTAATLPQRRDGLLALAQQYARADEIVLRRRRPISFLDPDGNSFAMADPEKGVVLTR